MQTLYRIYLAGPDLFFRDDKSRYELLKKVCHEQGLIGVAPNDGMSFPVENTDTCARNIRRHDLAMLRSCDAVLANVTPFSGTEPDSGTAYEMGFAAALGKPIVAYTFDGLLTDQRIEQTGRVILADGRDDRDGLLVENFGLAANLMLAAEHPIVCDRSLDAQAVVAYAAAMVRSLLDR